MDIKINKSKFTDKDILLDAILSQKEIAHEYNKLILNCTTPQTRNSIVTILCENYRILGELTDEMKKRDWLFSLPIDDELSTKIKDNLLNKD